MIDIIIFICIICISIFTGCGIALWLLTLIMKASNKAGSSSGDFYHNTKMPIRVIQPVSIKELLKQEIFK